MSIRIVNSGNSALDIALSYDECVIESTGKTDEETGKLLSHITKIKDGNIIDRKNQWKFDEEVSDHIADLFESDAIGSVDMDGDDVVIRLRELGEEGIEIPDGLLPDVTKA